MNALFFEQWSKLCVYKWLWWMHKTWMCDLCLGNEQSVFPVLTMKALWQWQSILFLTYTYSTQVQTAMGVWWLIKFPLHWSTFVLPIHGIPRIFSRDNKPTSGHPVTIMRTQIKQIYINFILQIPIGCLQHLHNPCKWKVSGAKPEGKAADYPALHIATPVPKHESTKPICQLPTPPQLATEMKIYNTANSSTYTSSRKDIALASVEV